MDTNNDAWISSILKLRHVSSSQTAVPGHETPSDDESDDDGNRTPVESTPIRMVSLSDSCTDEEDEGTPPENDKFHTPPERLMKDGVSTDEEDTPSKKAKADELEEREAVRMLLEFKSLIDCADFGMGMREFGSECCGLSSLGEGEKEGEDGKSGGVEVEIEGVISREIADDVGEKCMKVNKQGSYADEYGSNKEAGLGESEIKCRSFREKENNGIEEGVKKNVVKGCRLSGIDCDNGERGKEDIASESVRLWSSGDNELKEGEDVKSGGVEIELKGLEGKVDEVVEECLTVKNLQSSVIVYKIRELEIVESDEDLINMTQVEHQAGEGMDENVEGEGFREVDQNNRVMERKCIETESLYCWTIGDNEINEGEDGGLEGFEMEIKGLVPREKLDDTVKEFRMVNDLESRLVECRNMEVEIAKSNIQSSGVAENMDDEVKESMETNLGMLEEDVEREDFESETLCCLNSGDNVIKEVEGGEMRGVEVEIEDLHSSEKMGDMVNECEMSKNSELSRVGSRDMEVEVSKSEIQALGITNKLDDEVKEGSEKNVKTLKRDGCLMKEDSLIHQSSDNDEVEEGEYCESRAPEMVMVGSLGLWARMDFDNNAGEETELMNSEQLENLHSNGNRGTMLFEKMEINVSNVVTFCYPKSTVVVSSYPDVAAVKKEGSSVLDSILGPDCNNRNVKSVESVIEGDQCREYVAYEVDKHENRNSPNKSEYRNAGEGLEMVVYDENRHTAKNIKNEEGIAAEEDQAAGVDTHVEVGWTALLGVLNRLADKERQTRKRKCCCEHTPKCCERSCAGLDLVEMAKK